MGTRKRAGLTLRMEPEQRVSLALEARAVAARTTNAYVAGIVAAMNPTERRRFWLRWSRRAAARASINDAKG